MLKNNKFVDLEVTPHYNNENEVKADYWFESNFNKRHYDK